MNTLCVFFEVSLFNCRADRSANGVRTLKRVATTSTAGLYKLKRWTEKLRNLRTYVTKDVVTLDQT